MFTSSITTVDSKPIDPEEFKRIHSQHDPRPERPKNAVDYEKLQTKQRAQVILDHYQLLMHYAIANDKSIPQTRVYFQKVTLGIATEPIIKNWFSDGL
ncbi:hypothetical protein LTR13_007766 [Exophiala sideris]|nr:hypothetical protein LTR13_007766 [Exophiala sideris]